MAEMFTYQIVENSVSPVLGVRYFDLLAHGPWGSRKPQGFSLNELRQLKEEIEKVLESQPGTYY